MDSLVIQLRRKINSCVEVIDELKIIPRGEFNDLLKENEENVHNLKGFGTASRLGPHHI